ncbi:nitroreductase [Maricurvus nonylphenolicus]|uniref:nitroreductase n=1 Tax=Maricurvus nonylphenolicus TaxID=1008307 RepID=UPI0036F20DB2
MSQLTVTEAINTRKSVRAFQDRPVDQALLRDMLTLAGKTASGSNLQPWKLHVLTGEVKASLTAKVSERMMNSPAGEEADIPIYPEKLADPWRSRRFECGETMYRTLGIGREDKLERLGQVVRNFEFFGAPVGLIFTMDRSLCETQLIDIGLIAENIQLLAKEQGLDTCAQASWTMWPKTIREVLGLPENEMVVLGMSLGYADEQAKVNETVQSRVALDDFVAWHGF